MAALYTFIFSWVFYSSVSSAIKITMATNAMKLLRLNLSNPEVRQLLVRGLAGQAESKSSSSSVNPNVPGLSTNCVKVPSEPVGPGAAKSGEYKNPEYYSYNVTSYFEAEVEMSKFRIPQPSNKK